VTGFRGRRKWSNYRADRSSHCYTKASKGRPASHPRSSRKHLKASDFDIAAAKGRAASLRARNPNAVSHRAVQLSISLHCSRNTKSARFRSVKIDRGADARLSASNVSQSGLIAAVSQFRVKVQAAPMAVGFCVNSTKDLQRSPGTSLPQRRPTSFRPRPPRA